MEAPLLPVGQEVELRCTVTPSDKRVTPFFEVPIHVPQGVSRLDVSFDYPKTDTCTLDIGILDSSATSFPTRTGFRGWSGGARETFFVASDDATPGYFPGPMPPGVWRILLGLYKVPPEGVDVTLTLRADRASRPAYVAPRPTDARRDKAGWYRGDLHCHTYHSDAKGAPELLAENARQTGLDFLAVTDHNTTSQWRYFGPNSSPGLVFVPGMELTTYRGHANIFGLSEWVDFRLGGSHHLDTLFKEAHRLGALVSVNHDKDPLFWEYDYPDMDCMEVYHGHWLTGNDGVLERYDRLLAEGRRISLIGGSDYHQPAELKPKGPFGLGKPTTVLWLPHLDAGSVVDGLRSGHGYVTESAAGPHLAFTADGHPVGSVLQATEQVEIKADVSGAAGDRLILVSEKGIVADYLIPTDTWQKTIDLAPPARFLRAEIVADDSRERLINDLVDWYKRRPHNHRGLQLLTNPPPIRRALSNPVYFESPKQHRRH